MVLRSDHLVRRARVVRLKSALQTSIVDAVGVDSYCAHLHRSLLKHLVGRRDRIKILLSCRIVHALYFFGANLRVRSAVGSALDGYHLIIMPSLQQPLSIASAA